jgi:hypothetical protein
MKKLGFVILLLTFVLGINAQVNKDSLRDIFSLQNPHYEKY